MLLPVLCTAMLLPPLSMGANLIPSAFAHFYPPWVPQVTCCCGHILIVTYHSVVILACWQLLLPPLLHNSVVIALTIAVSKDAPALQCYCNCFQSALAVRLLLMLHTAKFAAIFTEC